MLFTQLGEEVQNVSFWRSFDSNAWLTRIHVSPIGPVPSVASGFRFSCKKLTFLFTLWTLAEFRDLESQYCGLFPSISCGSHHSPSVFRQWSFHIIPSPSPDLAGLGAFFFPVRSHWALRPDLSGADLSTAVKSGCDLPLLTIRGDYIYIICMIIHDHSWSYYQ